MGKDQTGDKQITKVEPGQIDLKEKLNPAKEIEFAKQCATALMEVIKSKKKQVIINGEQYIEYEDWQTIARFYNITVGTDWAKELKVDNKLIGYEARAVVYNQQGITIGSAEASCEKAERNWGTKPDFQLKSMAQTRASAKALRNVLGWVVMLAGLKATPAEEIDRQQTNNRPAQNNYRQTPPPIRKKPPVAKPNLVKLNKILKENKKDGETNAECIDRLSGLKVAGEINEQKAAAIVPAIVI